MLKYFKRVAVCGIISTVVWISGFSNNQGFAEDHISIPLIQTGGISVNQLMMQLPGGDVRNSMRHDLLEIFDVSAARAYLDDSMDKIQRTVNGMLTDKEQTELTNLLSCRGFWNGSEDCVDEPRQIP